MEQYALYLVIKKLIKDAGFSGSITYNDYDSNKDNVVGVIIKGGSSPKYRELGHGKYYGFTSRVQILMQSGLSKNSLINALELSSKVREVLTSDVLNNIYQPTGIHEVQGKLKLIEKNSTEEGNIVNLGISSTHMIGDIDFKGKTGQTRSVYSLNMLINYFIYI